MTIREALVQGAKLLDDAGIAEPKLTAEVLLMAAVSLNGAPGERRDRAWLYAHATDELIGLWWIHYGRYLHQRLNGMPVQYITGRQEFYGREFQVSRDVLIPRPETEHVIEAALARVNDLRSRHLTSEPAIVDIGTGSGAIAVTLALELASQNAAPERVPGPGPRVFATDISEAALKIARANAVRLGALVDFVACDLGSAFRDHTFDFVVSNPPYVPLAKAAGLQKEIRDYEPRVALFGGEDGLDVYRRLIPEAARLLRQAGWLMMEVGVETAEPVKALLTGWQSVELLPDLAGLPRVAVARIDVAQSRPRPRTG